MITTTEVLILQTAYIILFIIGTLIVYNKGFKDGLKHKPKDSEAVEKGIKF